MRAVISCSISKELYDMEMEGNEECPARYTFEPVLKNGTATRTNIVNFFLVLYTDCTQPHNNGGVEQGVAMIIHTIEGFDLEWAAPHDPEV